MSIKVKIVGVDWRLMVLTGFGAYPEDVCNADRVFGEGYVHWMFFLKQFSQAGWVSWHCDGFSPFTMPV